MEIIAEIGQNHNGNIELAKQLIFKAAECGADVAKFQLFDSKKLFSKENNPWYDYNLSTELTLDQVNELQDTCRAAGIEFMASAFDVERVGWLNDIGVDRYKLASRSVRDASLLDAMVATGKRLLVSLGMWDQASFPVINAPGGVDFLYCISEYPTPLEKIRLAQVDFTRFAGFSDHSEGITAAVAAFARGARIVEKHFTLDKEMYGPDHKGSMTPNELRSLAQTRDELLTLL